MSAENFRAHLRELEESLTAAGYHYCSSCQEWHRATCRSGQDQPVVSEPASPLPESPPRVVVRLPDVLSAGRRSASGP